MFSATKRETFCGLATLFQPLLECSHSIYSCSGGVFWLAHENPVYNSLRFEGRNYVHVASKFSK